ncbi:hexokinase-10-like isoform X2 [Phragmites australis]|uniref:hexokinase-10-like isoform X2 n=1 Tax=Phragmites australis TaxID=29695 RepID=UPI002D777DF1|nr:hexokinase-10-like isoform X2 [Phragmites australis]
MEEINTCPVIRSPRPRSLRSPVYLSPRAPVPSQARRGRFPRASRSHLSSASHIVERLAHARGGRVLAEGREGVDGEGAVAARGGGVRGGGDVRGGDGAGGAAGDGTVAVEPGRGGGARVRGGVRHAYRAAAAGRQLPGHRDVRGARVRGCQQGPDAAHLRRRAPQRVGKDVAQCLNEALVRNGLNLQVTALVNNAVGTLALGHYYDEDTVAAVIIGAGINASYIERSVAITKCCGLLTNSGDMVVNVEWGSFRPPQIPLTPYDICFNDGTHNYYDQAFEKMISGVYLGEITRLVLQRMAQESDVFGSAVNCLSTPFILSTPCLAAIREDDSPDLKEVGRVLEEHLKIQNVPLKTRRLVMRICDIVTRRAARLAAAGIVAVLQKIGRDGTLCGTTEVRRIRGETKRSVVAIEGGLYQGYSVFREYLNEAIGEILGDEVASTVSLRVVEEGSGIGAALLAASYSSTRQNSA